MHGTDAVLKMTSVHAVNESHGDEVEIISDHMEIIIVIVHLV
jgi:hypothetical protein